MDGLGFLLLAVAGVWFLIRLASSSKTQTPVEYRAPSLPSFGQTETAKRTVGQEIQKSKALPPPPSSPRGSFRPADKCSCGGTWVKRENSETGGRFFSCSRYPTCKNTRQQVLRQRLGSRYSDFYCPNGHEKAHFGIVKDPRSNREICKRCIDKGLVLPPSEETPKSPVFRSGISAPKSDETRTTSRKRSNKDPKLCRNGHPRTPENLYIRPDGSRECRICRKNSRR
jgi:ssDNA-binding Zn-finger/Zn-ribbon topoisomerase 1